MSGEGRSPRGIGGWIRLLSAFLWAGIIFWVASRPKAFFLPKKGLFGIPRQLFQYPYHIGAFFILTVLLLRCPVLQNSHPGDRQSVILSLLGSLVVSSCSEIIQLYIPTRSPAVGDLALDLLGTLLGVVLIRRP